MPEPTLTCKGLLHKLFYTPAPTFGIYIDDWERKNSTAISKLSNPDTISKELVENLVTDAIVYMAQKHDPVLAQMSTNTMEQKHAIEDRLFISDYLVLLRSAVNPLWDVLTDTFVDVMKEKSPLCRSRMEKDGSITKPVGFE